MKLKAFALILVVFAVVSSSSGAADRVDPSVKEAKERACIWLKNQKVPNNLVMDPQPERRNLVLSYEIPQNAPSYKYIFGRSIIYDDALAAIALTMQKDYKSAAQVLLALKRLQRPDGGLWFGYNVNNDWPSEKDFEGSVERTGATAWVGYAAVYYLTARAGDDASFIQTSREAKAILEFARSLADYLVRLQVQKSSDLRFGLITGGKNSFTLKLQNNTVNELFTSSEIGWISAEHNIDAYFFLKEIGALTKNDQYMRSAALIKSSMMRIWKDRDGQYCRGIKTDRVDDVLALDCASWGAVFSLSAGRKDYAAKSLAAIEKLYRSSSDGVWGYKPYANKEIYEDGGTDITKFYFPGLNGTTWDKLEGVWVEGSMGAAFAYLKTGDRKKAEEIARQMLPLQREGGGFIYFTKEVPHEFSTYVSLASTAWFIMVVSALEDKATADSFWKAE